MRLLATMRLDVVNQFRQGFYIASLVVLLAVLVAFCLLPVEARVLLPLVLLTNMLLATFVFLAGLVLLEKGEGTLATVIVSPLRAQEYLASKIATLAGLGVLENLIIASMSRYRCRPGPKRA